MAIAHSTHRASAGVADQLHSVAASFQDYRARRKLFRQTYRELNELSNRELADLGINRSMIRRLAFEAAKAA